MNSHIRVIPAKDIDRLRWDNCIASSPNSIIYVYSFYLDYMAHNWSGIVAGDYEAVMPVPWRKKFGIRYTYDVPFIQQLGWYISKGSDVNPQTLLKSLFQFVKYGSYSFNHGNKIQTKGTSLCNNYVIPLSATYEAISANYSSNVVNNLKRAGRLNLRTNTSSYEESVYLYRAAYRERLTNTHESDYLNFTALCKALHSMQMVFARKVVDEKSGEILSSGLFLRDERRIYNMMPCTSAEGRKAGAGHFLTDGVLREFAESGLTFDFEGSDIEGIKLFYESFGAVNQPYLRMEKFNHLPLPLNLLKR
jgi:hypothetical protein